jgi:hypothetical protein
MLIALLLLALQDDEAILRDARAFAKEGTDSAKEALLRAGSPAIRTLLEVRDDASFDRITDLLFTLRFADAKGRALGVRDHFALHRLSAGGGRWSLDSILARAAVYYPSGRREPKSWIVYVDPAAVPDPEQTFIEIPEKHQMGKVYVELDRALAPLKLDYAFRYGVLLVSTAARLWPLPPRRRTLTPAELEPLKRYVSDLDSADPEAREKAVKEIPAYGAEALPLLRAVASSEEAKTRAGALLRALEPRCGEPVWTTSFGLDRQTLSDDDRAVAAALNNSKSSLPESASFDAARLDAVLSVASRAAELRIECAALDADRKVTLELAGLTPRDALMLLARTHGLDFIVRDGRILLLKESR